MTQTMIKASPAIEQTPQAIAEVFWLAFNALGEPEKQAVLRRFQAVSEQEFNPNKSAIEVKPVHLSSQLIGLVSWGGDALEDSEKLYDQ